MKCPYCGGLEEKVVDSREGKDGAAVRRRRQCQQCRRRFTTYERIEEIHFMVVKKDGRREPFDRHKILAGLLKATQKRPVSVAQLEKIVDDIEARFAEGVPLVRLDAEQIRRVIINLVDNAIEAMERRAPALLEVGIAHRWGGYYEVTPDHNAVIGEASSVSRFLYAAGFSGHGFLQGPAVGEVVRDLWLGHEPVVDVRPLAAERFAEGTLVLEHAIV